MRLTTFRFRCPLTCSSCEWSAPPAVAPSRGTRLMLSWFARHCLMVYDSTLGWMAPMNGPWTVVETGRLVCKTRSLPTTSGFHVPSRPPTPLPSRLLCQPKASMPFPSLSPRPLAPSPARSWRWPSTAKISLAERYQTSMICRWCPSMLRNSPPSTTPLLKPPTTTAHPGFQWPPSRFASVPLSPPETCCLGVSLRPTRPTSRLN